MNEGQGSYKHIFGHRILHTKLKVASFDTIKDITSYVKFTYKACKFKNDPMNLTIPLNELIQKRYNFNVVVNTLKLVFVDTNIHKLVASLHKYQYI